MNRPVARRAPSKFPAREAERGDTRARLLDCAGEIFAEKGFDGARGGDICVRAQVNPAAINYYFGGMDGLYEAVLLAARARLPTVGDLAEIAAQGGDARAKLKAIVRLVIATVNGPASQSWVLRLMGREALSPSPLFERLMIEGQGLPKIAILKTIIGEIMGLPADHPAVARGCISVMAPCQMLLIADRRLWAQVYPPLARPDLDAADLAEHLVTFALGGLAAVAQGLNADLSG